MQAVMRSLTADRRCGKANAEDTTVLHGSFIDAMQRQCSWASDSIPIDVMRNGNNDLRSRFFPLSLMNECGRLADDFMEDKSC
jgi:hypothetical protein